MFSVVIPAYNQERYIGESIRSVFDQEGVTCKVQIVVVDDGSTDATREIMQSLELQGLIDCIYQDNKGVSAARNAAIEKCNYDYVAFLDADDVWEKNKLRSDIDAIKLSDDIVMLYSRARVIDQAGGFIRRVDLSNRKLVFGTGVPGTMACPLSKILNEDVQIPTSSVIIRKDVLKRVGGFDESLTDIEDTLLWYKVLQFGSLHFHDEQLVQYRIHRKSWNASNAGKASLNSRRFRLYLHMLRDKIGDRGQVMKNLTRIGVKVMVLGGGFSVAGIREVIRCVHLQKSFGLSCWERCQVYALILMYLHILPLQRLYRFMYSKMKAK